MHDDPYSAFSATAAWRSSPPSAPWRVASSFGSETHDVAPAVIAATYASVCEVPLEAVVILDHRAFGAVVTRALRSRRHADGMVSFVAQFANCAGERLRIRARVRVLRHDGTREEPPPVWRTLVLDPRMPVAFRAACRVAWDASSYYIEIDRERPRTRG